MTLERGNAYTPVASATVIWPWGTALAAGAVTGIGSFLLNLGGGAISSGLTTGIFFFALVGGVVGVISKRGDRRGRRYAATYPFRYAAVPAVFGGAATAAVTLFAAGLGSAIWGGLFAAALLWVLIGVVTMVAGNKNA